MSSPVTTLPLVIGESEHWLPPARLLAELQIRPGMNVCEIGSGKAFYTVPLGHGVGPAGNVFAVEWRPSLVDELRVRLRTPGEPNNICLVARPPADTSLAEASCDLVIFADIWHAVEERDAALDEARRILRPGGRLAIFNWRPEAAWVPGPPMEHRVSMRHTLCAVERKSWSLVGSGTAGLDGYLLVFEVTDESVQS